MRITPHLPDILGILENNPIVFLVAPTGSGKSLGLPAAIAANDAKTRIFISVPTRTAAISLANTASVLLKGIQVTVGYAAEGEVKYTDKTQIVYATSGHLRRKLIAAYNQGTASSINFCDILVIDEIHSGSIDNTVNIALWEKAAYSDIEVPRLVLASATFPEHLMSRFPEGVKYEVPGQTFPIEVQYHRRSFKPNDNSSVIFKELNAVIRTIISRVPQGDIIVFLPGSTEVETMIELLRSGPSIGDVLLLPAYGALSSEDLTKIHEETTQRKVIVATNIAETSITIDNLDIVIDSMLEKRSERSASGGERLTLSLISQDSAIQRCGRTGRLKSGLCYRMITEADFKALDKKRPDDIHRLPLIGTLIEILSIGLKPELLLGEISPEQINKDKETLQNLGCYTTTITQKGLFVAKFPLSVRNACILYECTNTDVPIFPVIVMIALIDAYGPSYIWIPRKESSETTANYNIRKAEYIKKYFDTFRDTSDVGTLLNLWHDYMQYSGGYPATDAKTKQWCVYRSIHLRKWKEMLAILKVCLNSLRSMKINVEEGPFTTDGLLAKIRPIIYNVYQDKILTYRNGMYYDAAGFSYRLDNKIGINKLVPSQNIQIIPLISIEISKDAQDKGLRIVSIALDWPISDQRQPRRKRIDPGELLKLVT